MKKKFKHLAFVVHFPRINPKEMFYNTYLTIEKNSSGTFMQYFLRKMRTIGGLEFSRARARPRDHPWPSLNVVGWRFIDWRPTLGPTHRTREYIQLLSLGITDLLPRSGPYRSLRFAFKVEFRREREDLSNLSSSSRSELG